MKLMTINKIIFSFLLISLSLISCKKEVNNGLDGKDGKDGICSGKIDIYISGNVTNEDAVNIIKNDFGHMTQNIHILNTRNLTTIDLSAVSELVNLKISGNRDLLDINFSNLKKCFETIFVSDNSQLKNVNLNKLELVNSIMISCFDSVSLINIDLSALERVSYLYIEGTNVTSLDLSSFVSAGSINIINNRFLSNINLSNLRTSNIYFSGSTISQLDFPLLRTGNISISDLPNLNEIKIPSLTSFDFFTSTNTTLNSTEINKLLLHFMGISTQLNRAGINLKFQNPLAPPTGVGISHKNTLIAQGHSVFTD